MLENMHSIYSDASESGEATHPNSVTMSVFTQQPQLNTIYRPNRVFPVTELLRCGKVFLLCSSAAPITLPPTFWENKELVLTPELRQEFDSDLNW